VIAVAALFENLSKLRVVTHRGGDEADPVGHLRDPLHFLEDGV